MRGERPDRQDEQDVADGLPRFRRPAGDARHRGHPRPLRPAARARRRPSCAAATSTARARRRRTASRCATRSACADWQQVLDSSDFAGAQRARSRSSTPRHAHTKRGLAITPVKFGISFNFTAFNQAGALVHVYKDGTVQVNHGGTEMGQGLHTKMLQVAATTLGVPLRAGPAGADAHRQGAQHLGHRGELRRRPERRARSRTPASRSASGWRGRRRSGSASVPPTSGSPTAHVRGLSPPATRSTWEAWSHRRTSSGCSCGRPASTAPRACTGTPPRCRARRSSTSPTARPRRGRGRRLHRRLPHAAGRHRARRRRQPLAAGRPRPDRGRLRAGGRLAHPGGPALGRERPARPRPADHPGGEHLQAAELLRDARGLQRRAARAGHRGRCGLRLEGRGRAAADAGLLGARGAAPGRGGVRPGGDQRRPGSPATPEAVYWAVERARHGGPHVASTAGGAGGGAGPAGSAPPPMQPRSEQEAHAPARGGGRRWTG